jgi:1-acyl-sn-glycerol-3-phosphate acyltransferase
MQQFFTGLHSYLKRRRIFFFILVALILGIAVFLSRNIRLEENLNAVIPEDQRISRISAAFDKSELADQIVFILSLKDTTLTEPGKLIPAASSLVEDLGRQEDLVKEINFRAGGSSVLEVYDFIYRNLPLFLEEGDYKELEKRITDEAIADILEKDFKALITPAGAATGRFILRDPLNITPIALEKLDRFRLDDNFILYQSAIFTRDLKHLLLFLDPAYSSSNTRENLRLMEKISESTGSLVRDNPEIRIQYYGGTAVAVANSVRVKKDILLTVSIAITFFLLIFLVFFRRIRTILLVFLPVGIGAMISVALLTLIYGEVSAIALGIGVIFIGITMDYSLHYFTHLREEGDPGRTAGIIATPILMSSLTTASAFLCLTVVRSSALNQIGVFAAVAVLVAAGSVLVITPLLTRRDPAGKPENRGKWSVRIEKAVGYPFEKNRWLVAIVLLLTVILTLTARNIRFNGDISTLNYQTAELDSAEATLQSISSVANSSVYLVTQGATLEEALEKLERNKTLFNTCRNEGLITELSWVPDLIPTGKVQEEKIERWNRFWDRAGRERIEQTLRSEGTRFHFRPGAFSDFYDLLRRDFNPRPPEDFQLLRGLFLDNYISEKPDGIALVSILKVDRQSKDELFSAISSSDDFIIFDSQFFINQFFKVLRDDFNKLVTFSMIVVFAILLLFFGRLEIALVTFIPILVSWMWTLGLMGLFGIEINIFNIIISTFIFGLGIDYCIFIMNGIMANYREGGHSLVPYKLSILLSALTTVAGIGVLIFARHPALKSIALVSIVGISTVVLISYTLLPLMFNFLTRSSGRDRLQPVTLFKVISTLVTFLLFLGCAGVVTLLLPVFILLPVRGRYKKRIISRVIYLFSSFIVKIGYFIKKKYVDMDQVDFSKPSVIVSNHQSQLDLVLMLGLHPRLIVLVNRWVWNNIFYGPIIRFADYYPVYKGLDYNFEKLKKKVEDGYSILAFPEGRRSPDGKIKRFHQGAFGLADMLGLEIQPLMVHGAFDCLPKTEHFLNPGTITLRGFSRRVPEATTYKGVKTYRVQAREMTAFYREEYKKLAEQAETPSYFRGKLISRFLYKGPVLEWYLRVKIRLEKDYRFFNELIPRESVIADLGCGYGFLDILLAMVSKGRTITGTDYDEYKVAVAGHAARDLKNLHFLTADITRDEPPEAEIYILNDVLHYLPSGLQKAVLRRCLEKTPEGGMVIVRDADADLKKRTRVTRFTELQSTRVFRFNKTRYKLEYLPGSTFVDLAGEYGFTCTSYDTSRFTSNITHVFTRPGELKGTNLVEPPGTGDCNDTEG